MGEKEEKAKFLFELAKTSGSKKSISMASPRTKATASFGSPGRSEREEDKMIVWSNRNLKYIFTRMFQLSIDFPFDASAAFESFAILDEEKMFEANPNLKSQIYKSDTNFYDFT